MTEIIDAINNLIYKAKENDGLDNVKFIKAYSNEPAQIPVQGYMAFVKKGKITQEQSFAGGYLNNLTKGGVVKAEAIIDVYCGGDVSGERLNLQALKIYQELLSADETGLILSSEISAIEYDDKLKAIYKSIKLNMAVCVGREDV